MKESKEFVHSSFLTPTDRIIMQANIYPLHFWLHLRNLKVLQPPPPYIIAFPSWWSLLKYTISTIKVHQIYLLLVTSFNMFNNLIVPLHRFCQQFHECERLTGVCARVVLEMLSHLKIPMEDISFYLKSSSREFSQTSKCSHAGPSSLAISFPVLVQNCHWHHQRHHHQYCSDSF